MRAGGGAEETRGGEGWDELRAKKDSWRRINRNYKNTIKKAKQEELPTMCERQAENDPWGGSINYLKNKNVRPTCSTSNLGD